MKSIYVFLLISTLSFSQNDDLQTRIWQEDKPLTWSDFKGEPNKSIDAAALTASGISFGYSVSKKNNRIVSFKSKITCVFYPTESWYKMGEATPHILRHEQIHFDITELFARKFRYEVSKLRPSKNIKGQFADLGKRLNNTAEQMQRQYDAQTNHSRNLEQQAEWDTFVTAELKKFDAYKSN